MEDQDNSSNFKLEDKMQIFFPAHVLWLQELILFQPRFIYLSWHKLHSRVSSMDAAKASTLYTMIIFLKGVKKVFLNAKILTFGEMGSSLVAFPDRQCCVILVIRTPQMHLGQQVGSGSSEQHPQQMKFRPRK